MTAEKTTERFLELEARANELLDGLVRLKQEATHYSQAAGTLDQVSEKVSNLVDPLQKLAEGLRDTVSGLRELGVGGLVDRASEIERLMKGLAEAGTKSDQRASEMAVHLDSLAGQEEVNRLREEVRTLREESTLLLQEIVAYQRRGFFSKLFGKEPR